MPASNVEYWSRKIERNIKRDSNSNAAYRRTKWKVIRIWEHSVKDDFDGCVRRIERAVLERLGRGPAANGTLPK
jgi:DNA mismatch endonuclease (patch repair protein)